MFNNSKYGNLLTVILIIAIVAIVGVIGIIIYRVYNAYYTDKGALQAATLFEQNSQNNGSNLEDANNVKTDITGIEGSAFRR